MTRSKALKFAKPILLNTEMVKAVEIEAKRVTRRVVKIQPKEDGKFERMDNGNFQFKVEPYGSIYDYEIKPPYQIGDILYVRETWCEYDADHVVDGQKYAYRADATLVSEETRKKLGYKWKPSIHMPKKAARFFLRVTGVRVERLQDITDEAAQDEGMPGPLNYPINEIYCPKCHGQGMRVYYGTFGYADYECPDCDTTVKRFANLWNRTVKKSDLELYGWQANPWVWVISFEKIEVK